MTYRDDLDAAQARADALQARVDELEAEKAVQAAPPAALPAAPRASAGVRQAARRGAVGTILFAVGIAGASLLVDAEVRVAFLLVAVGCVPCAIGLLVIARQHVQAGVDEALIISGNSQGLRILAPGAGRFLVPIIEQAQRLDLTPVAIAAELRSLYTEDNLSVVVALTARVRITRTDDAIRRAAERFLGAAPETLAKVARETLEGAVRAVVARLSLERLRKEPEYASDKVLAASRDDLEKLGLEAETLTIANVVA